MRRGRRGSGGKAGSGAPRPRASRTPGIGLARTLTSVFALSMALALALGAAAPVPVWGQEEPEIRVLTVVDYVAGQEVYLASGTDHGIRVGDTLPVYDGEGGAAELLGTFVIQSANERRSVATFVGTPFSVVRADLLYLGLPEALARTREAREEVGRESEVPPPDEAPKAVRDPSTREAPGPPVRVDGRISLDMDALQTTTRWGELPEEEVRRTFSTPTFRLHARVRDLPGGVRLNTSMRLSHRTSPDRVVQPVTSLRFYQFDLEKRFDRFPVQLHVGRFHNPFEDYSGYWDGMMVHYGEEGFGGGAALGYEPELWNEAVNTDRPKASVFVDYNAQGQGAGYSGALSFHTVRPRAQEPDRSYVGMSQRIRLGNAWIRQRLQVDRSVQGADWTLTRLQLDASLPLTGGLSAHAGWRRWRTYYALLPTGELGPRHDRGTFGASYWTVGGGVSADLSLDRPADGEEARTVSSSFFLRRTPFLGLGFSGMASYWTRGNSSSLLLTSEAGRDLGVAEVRGGFQFYETSGDFGQIRSQASDVSLTFPLGGGVWARLRGFVQWGGDLTSNRILASLWKSF